MNGVASLEREARQLLGEVLAEKDLVISSFSQQICHYQQEIARLTDRLPTASIDHHTLQDLAREGFIRGEQDRLHLLVDVTALTRQNSTTLHLDSRAQIIKEVEAGRDGGFVELMKALRKAQAENEQLKRKAEQGQARTGSLLQELALVKEEHSQERQRLLQKIRMLQQQNEIQYLEGKGERIGQEQYEALLAQCSHKDRTIAQLAKSNQLLEQQIATLATANNSHQQEKAELERKCGELLDHSDLLNKQLGQKVQSTRPHPQQKDSPLEGQLAFELECSQLMKEREQVCAQLQRLREEHAALAEKNDLLTSLLNNFAAESHPGKQSQEGGVMEELINKVKALNPDEQVIVHRREGYSLGGGSGISVEVSKIKIITLGKEDKETPFPVALSPSQEKGKGQGRKKMIRIGY